MLQVNRHGTGPDVTIPGWNLRGQSLAVDFIENRLDKYHSAFSTPPSRYDPNFGGFVIHDPPAGIATQQSSSSMEVIHQDALPGTVSDAVDCAPVDALSISPRPSPRPVEALNFWDSLFPQAMSQVNRLHSQEPEHLIRCGQRIRDKTDWTQVFDQVKKARDEYFNVDNNFRAEIRKVYRKFGDRVAEPFNRMTKLVPGGGDLGTVAVTPIVGCVQILLEAARAASSVRSKMTGAFDQVDNMFSEIEIFLEIYPGDKNIEKSSIDLIASTLFAAENVIGFFTKRTWKKLISATTQRENYERKTVESLEDVKTKCELLLHEAGISDKYHSIYAMKAIMDRSADTHIAVQHISHDVRNTVLELLDESEQRLLQHFRRQANIQDERIRAGICLAMAEVVSRSSPTSLPWPQIGSTSIAQRYITPEDLLNWIAIPNLLVQDLQTIAERRKVQVPEREQARAEQIVRTGQFREWLTAPASTQLLVHGNYDRRAYMSGLTLFCMSLTSTLAERSPRFIPLTFFCGLHTEPLGSGAHTGGRAIVRSFIGQLLQQYDFGNCHIPAGDVDDRKIQLGDVVELCKLFEGLVRTLPSHVVLVCLIDGILYYERQEFKEEMAVILIAILQLSNDSSIRVPVKVLITSPTKTTEVRMPFPDHLILSMDAMARSDLVASNSRLDRELGSGLE